ncbi:nuclear transport factor 2 family protein [Nocardia vinacea]|uniref:nuclear transport factor 2 family protein n=1 Tax=Nocardia vinacea TaxID=96468 RepID=UPI00343CEDED
MDPTTLQTISAIAAARPDALPHRRARVDRSWGFAHTHSNFLIDTPVAPLGEALANADPGRTPAQNAVDPAVSVAAVHSIKQLKAHFFRAIDTKDWAMLRQLVTDDVVVDTTASAGMKTIGANAFIGFLRSAIGSGQTVHQGHMPEIDVISPRTATGVWAMQEDLLICPADIRVLGFGHYHETYALVDEQWRISSSKLTRLYLDPVGEQRLFGM